MKNNKLLFVFLLLSFMSCKQKPYTENEFWSRMNKISLKDSVEKRKLIKKEQILFHEELVKKQRKKFIRDLREKNINLESDKFVFFESYELSNGNVITNFQLLVEITNNEPNIYCKELDEFYRIYTQHGESINRFYNNFPEYSDYCNEAIKILKNKTHYFIITKTNNNRQISQTININFGWTHYNSLRKAKFKCQNIKKTAEFEMRLSAFFIGYVETGIPY